MSVTCALSGFTYNFVAKTASLYQSINYFHEQYKHGKKLIFSVYNTCISNNFFPVLCALLTLMFIYCKYLIPIYIKHLCQANCDDPDIWPVQILAGTLPVVFHGFPQLLQANVRTVPQPKPQPLSYTFIFIAVTYNSTL